MENLKRYNTLKPFLINKFGEKVGKICIDGNFTCPNRDGKVSYKGCIFCSEQGSGEHIKQTLDISKQVKDYLTTYKAQRVNKYIAYFQNFTNTYDTIENLKEKYDSALITDKIVSLAIATRPDCITEEIVKLLASYSNKYYVFVELGLQTSNDTTAQIINRGYTKDIFTKAVSLLRKYNIDVVTHIMVGLPNETLEDVKETLSFINSHDVQGIKVHSTYIVQNTILEKIYLDKKYIPLSLEEYLEALEYIITHSRPDLIIHRISGDAPKDILVAPSWNSRKKLVMNGIDKILREKNLYQGCFYEKKEKF